MKDFFNSLIVFMCCAFTVFAFSNYNVPTYVIQQVLAVLIVMLLITINLFYHASASTKFKWFLLFLTSLVVQLLVVSTGGLYSPFLILFHFLALGISLLFSLNTSLLFVVFSVFILLGGMAFDNTLQLLWYEDPASAILYGISFLSIIPVAQLLAHRYKVKDTIVAMLTNQIEVEESIIAELNELVFVTDREGNILAVNDAVEDTLLKSRAELLHKPLFSLLFIRDKDGKVINKKNLDLNSILEEKTTKNINGISILATSVLNNKKVNMRIKPVRGLKGVVDQISFIISSTSRLTSNVHKNLEEANARHDAKIEELKKKLRIHHAFELHHLVLIERSEKDILTARTLEDHMVEEKKVPVDVASLCKQTVVSEQEFFEGFRVPVKFAINDFGRGDIAPLITPLFAIVPERFTGPFFTAFCEVKYFSIAIQKLLEVAVLLASSEENPSVELSVERQGNQVIMITITASAAQTTLQKQADIFVMYYGALASKTNLSLGSGLEGYLAKRITDTLNIPLKILVEENEHRISFQLKINKEKNKYSFAQRLPGWTSLFALWENNRRKALHILCSLNETVDIITVYEPDLTGWEEDLKTRRKET